MKPSAIEAIGDVSGRRHSVEPCSESSREFRLGSEYRRCGWYAFLGSWAIFGIAAFLRHRGLANPNGGWSALIGVNIVMISAAFGLLVFVDRWRLRVDEHGIARRRWRRWDLWTWGEFASGDVTRRGSGFQSKSRPRWRSYLEFSLLSGPDRAFVEGVCKRMYVPFADHRGESIPDGEIVLHYQCLRKSRIRHDGIAGTTGWRTLDRPWSDVREVRLVFFDHWSEELRRVEFDVPEGQVRIEGVHKIRTSASGTAWASGQRSIPIVVANFLAAHVPSGKLARHALRGPPVTLAECSHRRRALVKRQRYLKWTLRILPGAIFILSVLCIGPKLWAVWRRPGLFLNLAWSVLTTVVLSWMMLISPLVIWAVVRERYQRCCSELHELDAWEYNADES